MPKFYRKFYLLLMLLTVITVSVGSYSYSMAQFNLFTICFVVTIILTILVFILTSKHYDFNILAAKTPSLIDKYENDNLRFLSMNDHVTPARDLAKELFRRSNQYIYIYTGKYNEKFYKELSPILSEKRRSLVDVKIMAQETIDNNIIPEGILPKENRLIKGLKHFMVTDYGFRIETSDITGDSTKAIFALNLSNSNTAEIEVRDIHKKLNSAFLEAWNNNV